MEQVNFFEDFKKNLLGQYEECKAYKLICDNQAYNPERDLKDEKALHLVPFITTTLFKQSSKLFPALLRVSPEKLVKWTVSSSTSGDPSIVGRTREDISQLRRFTDLDLETIDPNCDYECVFFPEPVTMSKHKSQEIFSKPTESYMGNLLQVFDFNENTIFLLKPNGDDFTLDIEAFKEFITSHDKKNHHLSLRGSTLLLFNAVEYLKDKIDPVELGKRTIIHTGGGGWDGKKGSINIGTKIERWRFVETVSKFLGVPEENFVDSYSFTENTFPINGHFSKEHRDYLFHVPEWGRVIIRDVKTLEPLTNIGDRGFLQVLNAYGTSAFAGASVLVDDMAEIVSYTECEKCGKKGMTIKIIGRVKGSEAKGCGATLSVKEGK